MKILEYSKEYKEIWDNFVKNSKNGIFMFERNFMDYHSDRFQDFSMMFYEDDRLVAIMPASLHGDEVRSHGGLTYGGFIVDNSMKQHRMLECFEILKKHLKQKNISRLIYKTMPYIFYKEPAQEDLYALFINKANLCRRDIATTIKLKDPIKLSKGRKAQISRAKRDGVKIIESEDFDTFIELENKILQEYHGAKAVHTADELRLLKSRFPERIRLFTSQLNGKIIAGTLLFVYENAVHTQYMAADETSREIGGLDLLIKTLVDKYAEDKEFFDFGISTTNGGLDLNTGLIGQKESFGGRSVAYDFYELKEF